ncbi:hypothetical protein BJA5080_06922 [Bradyrhizobium diazoefficiens SEMIA 5080]|uniref:Uncharacterized protein n=1 Tax=Bradyrhizobium diazoefficiens SEMIA 5080 TaxID=754504 RepID=A0A837CM93_9BRAD|nr:hypothetical protein BJA5080_06922 [Bradyrhizobium diazoefficiens SEMIA 5080]
MTASCRWDGTVAGPKGMLRGSWRILHPPPSRLCRLAAQWWGVAAAESTPERPIGRVVPLFPRRAEEFPATVVQTLDLELRNHLRPDCDHPDEQGDRCQCGGFFHENPEHGLLPCWNV